VNKLQSEIRILTVTFCEKKEKEMLFRSNVKGLDKENYVRQTINTCYQPSNLFVEPFKSATILGNRKAKIWNYKQIKMNMPKIDSEIISQISLSKNN